MIDNVDKIILQALQENARISNADLARRAGGEGAGRPCEQGDGGHAFPQSALPVPHGAPRDLPSLRGVHAADPGSAAAPGVL